MKHAPGVKMAMADGGAILLDTRVGMVFDLNQAAALIWSALEGGAPEHIADLLQRRFSNVAYDVILADVRSCLAELATRHLIIE